MGVSIIIKNIISLNTICDTLINNIKNEGASYKVEDIINGKPFNELSEIESNNLNNPHSKNEFKGIYAFASIIGNKVDFRYIGISQTIRRRFRGHTKCKTKLDASWAYKMAKHAKYPKRIRLTSSEIEKLEKISDVQKKIIYPLRFTFCLIPDDMMMHMAEVYCSNKLNSSWNTFKTPALFCCWYVSQTSIHNVVIEYYGLYRCFKK